MYESAKYLVLLIGNIGTGKTTFCKSLNKHNKKIISPDDYSGSIDAIKKQFEEDIELGISNYKFVIIDGKNLTIKGRDKLLYYKRRFKYTIAIDFGKGDKHSCQRRLEQNKNNKINWIEIHKNGLNLYEPQP